ncbi:MULTISPECIES: serine/threonine-protein kinase [unclassified Streptomyces]|uniref:serine/threonine-protein kinase n=1 Tax=unclassified Streptomyces TaxID=2593676 RepID=UPI00093E6A45|nr:serine/threonine-protein kinase [Streptomyces sp. CB02058]OKI88957.1 hypothetical protein AMK10_32270 [Streptomyces sp. CB02058]
MRDELLGGRYRLVQQIAEGGMGQVWEARDESLGRPVAVKVISLLAGGGSQGTEARARFLREAQITARLQHPNIVTIHDLGETDTRGDSAPFLVMELVRGEGLDAVLRRGDVTRREAARWGAQICDALAEAHESGIMHRDIKPSNILITSAGLVKVLDFGIARAADPYATSERLTRTGFIVGTPPYMAPEQARGHPEPRSDLYALGCVLFELLTGRLPFQAPDAVGHLSAHLTQEPPAPSSVATGIPSEWDELVLTLLDKDPGRRYEDAAELARALRRFDQEARTTTAPPDESAPIPTVSGTTPLPPVGRIPRSRRTATFVTASVCLLTAPIIPVASDQACTAGMITSNARTLHMTLFGVVAAVLVTGLLLLWVRNVAGRWLIMAGGTAVALQALSTLPFYGMIGLVLRGLIPLAAAAAVLSAVLAVLPSTGGGQRPSR